MSDNAPIVSTGRGGQGNIGRDSTKYADAGIVREGVEGESVDGNYSSGRGGAGNVVPSPRVGPQARRGSHDKIPDAALLGESKHDDQNYHIGRGGGGNVHRVAGAEKHAHQEGHHEGGKESVVDKAKHLLHLDKDKKHEKPAPSA